MRPTPAPGTASFPRSPNDLRSTEQCPACFAPLRAAVCHVCGLNLAHPLAAELASLSTTIADGLDARLRIIDRMRREPVAPAEPAQAAPAAAPTTAPPAAVARSATTAPEVREPAVAPPAPALPLPSPEPVPAAQTAAPPTAVAPPAVDERPRRSGIQIALVIVGIALLSVFALFGVIYVFIAYGVVARSVIIGLASLATLVVASLLARRGLGATAEGLAALGTVVLLLDAWAVRRTDVAGLGAVSETGYWGGALLVVAVIALIWARLGGHRSPLLVGANLIPPGSALLAVHLASDLPRGAAPSLAALAAATATVVVLVAGRRAFAISHTSAVVSAAARTPLVALVVAAVAALVGVAMLSTSGWWWGTAVVIGVAFLTGLAAWLLTRTGGGTLDTAIAAALVALGSIGLLTGLTLAAAATESEAATLALALLAPATLLATADIARMRVGADPGRPAITAAGISAAIVGALAATLALVIVLTPLGDAVASRADADRTVTSDVLGVGSLQVTAVAGLAVAIAILVAAARAAGRLGESGRALPLAAGAGLTVALTSAVMPTWWALMTCATVVSIAAALALSFRRTRGDSIGRAAARLGFSVAAVAAALIAVSLGWAVDGGWWVGIVVALVALGLGRRAAHDANARAVATTVSGLLAAASAPSIASITALDPVALTLAVVSVVVILGRVLNREPGERALLSTTLLPLGLSLAIAQLVVTPATTSLHPVVSALTFLIAVVVVASDPRSTYGRYAGLALVALAAVALSDRVVIDSVAASAAATSVSTHERAIVALATLALVAAASALTTRRTARWVIDSGVAVTAIAALPVALDSGLAPLSMLIAAVGALALATRDWTATPQPLRVLAAAATLLLAVAALALFLGDTTARNEAATVLPIGAALLAVTVALRWRTPADGPGRALSAAVAALIVVALGPTVAVTLTIDTAATTLLLAAIVLGLARLPRRDIAERAATVAATVPVALVLALAIVVDSGDRTLLAAGAIAALLLALTALLTDARRGIDRTAAFATLGLAAALVTTQGIRTAVALIDDDVRVPDAQLALAALSAMTVLAVIGALTVRGRDRLALDIGLAAIAVPTAILVTDGGRFSLALTMSAVLLLAVAISRDGLFGSQSKRRFLGWAALASATAALWSFLADRGVENPEPFTLPLAAVLLAIAGLLARVPVADSAARTVSGPTIIAVSALAVAGLPLAALAGEGPVTRGASVGVIATALVLAVIIGRVHSGIRWRGLPQLLLGVAVVTQVVLSISVTVRVDLEAATRGGTPVDAPLQVAAVLIVVMLIGTAAATWVTLPRSDELAVPRTVSVTTAATAGTAALCSAIIGLSGAMEQVELIAIPLALGLLLIGTFELDRRAAARSLPWLTPGFVALLLPSLIAVDVDGGVWRIAALGIAATIILIGGVVRRLQAPFLVGVTVLLVHAGIQTWPLIAEIGESIEWWLWLGIAGVAIVAVAARYERRVQNVKNTVRRISELR
jgi:hypothetical protein